jgi:hypothetical protein
MRMKRSFAGQDELIDPKAAAAQARALAIHSGEESSDEPLVSFLYELMRDHVPAGVVEQILLNSPPGRTKFTNGYLARYAREAAYRLRPGQPEGG